MCADDGAPIATLFDRAHAAGVATSLDLAFVAENSPVRDLDWTALLRSALSRTDLFCPSWSDLVSCLGVPADPDRQTVREWADRFLEWGAGVVLFTLGDKGCHLRAGERLEDLAACGIDPAAWSAASLWQIPEPIVEVTTTNGAGDAYKAAFLSRLVEGDGPQECLSFADRVVARYLKGQPLRPVP
jgi:sugar/nucleoside kinase (ribokinase family)